MKKKSGCIVSFLTIVFLLISQSRKLVFCTGLLLLVILESRAANVFFSQYERPVNGEGKYIQIVQADNGDIYILDIGSQSTELVSQGRQNGTPLVDPLVSSGRASVYLTSAPFTSFQTERLEPLRQQLIAQGVSEPGVSVVTGLDDIFNRTYYVNRITPENDSVCDNGIIAIESLTVWIQQLQRGLSADPLTSILNQLAELHIPVFVPELVIASGVPPSATVQSIAINRQGGITYVLQVTVLVASEGGVEPVTTELTLTRNQGWSRVDIPPVFRASLPQQNLSFRSPPELNNVLQATVTASASEATATATRPEDTPNDLTEDEELAIFTQVRDWIGNYKPGHALIQVICEYLANPTLDRRGKLRRQLLGFWRIHQNKQSTDVINQLSGSFETLEQLEKTRAMDEQNNRRSHYSGGIDSSEAAKALTASAGAGWRPTIASGSNPLNSGGGVDVSVPLPAIDWITREQMHRGNHQSRDNRQSRGNHQRGDWQRQNNENIRDFSPSGHSASTSHQANEVRYGCKHAQRNCDIRIRGCSEFFSCRRCHDDQCKDKNCSKKKTKAGDTEVIRCGECGHDQVLPGDEPQQNCPRCNLKLGEYFCKQCLHYRSNDNEPFHCDKCGICRDNKSRSYHCDKCGLCMDVQLKDTHKCRDDSAHDECCICLEDTFTGCQVLPCSHKIHRICLQGLTSGGITECPMCREPL